ncbi:MAG: sigma 54-interacting transcriptional regulator [Treponema sp.]|jgi:Nif-specific regulatory protein|nr:sigma 54-interacting transcriptional regulator [Treponema sp.]
MLAKIDAKKFNTLIEANALINSDYADLNSLLTNIVDLATKLCEGEASCLLLVNDEKKELYFEVSLGGAGKEVKRFTMKIGEGIAGWVALHNKSIIVDSVQNDSRHRRDISQELKYTAENMLAVPMRVKDQCVGVIEIINKKNGKNFTQEDMEWLEIFATQAGIALVNARSMETAQSKIEQLQDSSNPRIESHSLIAKSPAILEKIEIINRIAKTDSSVLILGESGVGKEIFAERIHLLSPRSSKPLVKVNCAAIPEGLIESELFGHVKGAFTNAVSDRYGRFKMADGGTIFLDEIAELPLSLQVKLLRVIQERSFEKVGSDATISVDIRILAATNRDIEKQVKKGEFREDLYYRLNVLPLHIPPLRQRHEDILALADFFLQKGIKKTKNHFDGFSEGAISAMLEYSWPGNVRELENCIERACVISKGPLIGSNDIFLKPFSVEGIPDNGDRNLKRAENLFRARYIKKVLAENSWNQTETAKALAIQRTYLSRLVKELEINNTKE